MLKKISTILIIICLVFIFCSQVFATSGAENLLSTSGEQLYTVPEVTSENIVAETGDKFISGQKEKIADPIDGNLFSLTDGLNVSNWIGADAFLLGNEIAIDTGKIEGNAFIISYDVTIDGTVNHDIFVMGDTVKITKTARIGGNVFVLANNLIINGTVTRNIYTSASNLRINEGAVVSGSVYGAAETVEINTTIDKDVYLASENITLSSKCLIGGNFTYESKSEINIAADKVQGTIKYVNNEEKVSIQTYIISFASLVLLSISVWAVLNKFGKKFIEEYSNEVRVSKILVSIVIGFVALIGIPLITLILMSTVIGLQLSLILLLLYILLLLLSFAITIIILANVLKNKFPKVNIVLLLLGVTLVLWLLLQIKYTAPGVSIVLITFGLGSVVKYMFKSKE
ncbi:MAG: polymer-forming cytoskeletal protein [Lachnospiraceae bacterium]|jgi:hypothetical protein|nr:polymer-forming cytoskeletal protein [Lachnospiraceae bacterium]